jgi:hypothetical protein
MDELDLNMSLLFADPIQVDKFFVHSLTLKEIREIRFSKYNMYLSYLCLDKPSIQKLLNTLEDIDPWDFLIEGCKFDLNFREIVLTAFKIFLKIDVYFNDFGGFFFDGDETVIEKDTFIGIVEILKKQNCIEVKEEKKKQNTQVSSEAQEYYNKLKIIRKAERYQECRNDKNKSDSDLSDVISSVSAKHPSLNLFNINNLTIYQLVNQFKRLHMIDDYSVSIKLLLAGASNTNTLTHWSTKIKDKILKED